MTVVWPSMSLREAGVSLLDCEHRTPPDAGVGYPYVAIPQIKNGRLDLSDVRRISSQHFAEWTRKAFPRTYDVILSRRCNPGETAVVPAGLECALGQNLVLLRADPDKMYPPFLRWLVRGPEWWEQIGKFLNVGAVFDSLKCADIPNFKLTVPPPAVQKRVADILGSLDDKIALNRRTNETLEAMARTLFSSWFNNLPTSAPLVTVSDLEREGILQIGDGYRTKRSELGEPGLPFVRAGDLKNGFLLEGAEYLSERSVSSAGDKVCCENDVVFTSKGTVGRFARVDRHTPRFVYSPQLCFWRVKQTSRLDPVILFYWMQSPVFLSQISMVKGQTDMAEYVSLQDQRRMKVHLPAVEDQRRVAATLTLLADKQAANRVESLTLAALRDALLPRLLSGEVRVDPEECFDAAQ